VAAVAAEYEPRGVASVALQHLHTDGLEGTDGKYDVGNTDTQSLLFAVEYYVTERWTLAASLPLIRKRYQGPVPHQPTSIVPPKSENLFIDTGNYHTEWQDVHLGVEYLAIRTPSLLVQPFVDYGFPSNDYPYFAGSAVGQNLSGVGFGVNLTYLPQLSDYYVRLAPQYVLMQKTRHQSINDWLIDAEVGYFVGPRWTLRAFARWKTGMGLDFPDDYPPPRNDEYWYEHDRMVRHNSADVGIGVDWNASPRTTVSLSALTSVWNEDGFILKYGVSAGIAQAF